MLIALNMMQAETDRGNVDIGRTFRSTELRVFSFLVIHYDLFA